MKNSIVLLTFFLFLIYSCGRNGDKDKNSSLKEIRNSQDGKLFILLKEKDSLLFQIGFNNMDTTNVSSMISKDFEFYHDINGITDSKNSFLESLNGLRDLPFTTWRVLVEESLEVFPLYKENKKELYGAIQNGTHDFYQQDKEVKSKAKKTNTANFTHLWIIEEGDWKLKRVFSFNHHIPEQ